MTLYEKLFSFKQNTDLHVDQIWPFLNSSKKTNLGSKYI